MVGCCCWTVVFSLLLSRELLCSMLSLHLSRRSGSAPAPHTWGRGRLLVTGGAARAKGSLLCSDGGGVSV